MHNRLRIPKMPFRDEFFRIETFLGVKSILAFSREQIDAWYTEQLKTKSFDLKDYFVWKVVRDPFYKTLVSHLKSFNELYEAGFFLDTLEPSEVNDLNFQPGECRTPIHQVAMNLEKIKKLKNPVVLLCTGAFSPIHNGHVGMMQKARETLEEQGYQVVGGYFSPSHDEYVSKKHNGEANFPAAHRIYLSQVAVSNTDWLFVDPWEARYLPTDVNFTDVVARLEAYLNFYLKPSVPIRVAYVFGADNAAFSKAFKAHGVSVCVARSDYGKQAFDAVRRSCKSSETYFTVCTDLLSEISSTNVRKWKTGLIPDAITRMYFGWRLNMLRDTEGVLPPKKLYVLRDDRSWALKHWQSKSSPESLQTASEKFLHDLTLLLTQSFRHVLAPDRAQNIEVVVYSLEDQMNYVKQLSQKERLLNLDVCTNEQGMASVQVSRLFALCNGQVRAERLVPRPGYGELEKQLQKIKAHDYTLIDDDIASGSTISMLMALLPEDVRVNKIRTLTEYSNSVYLNSHLKSVNADLFDMVDLRDFIFGSSSGGLVIELPDKKLARAPYSLPYISLTTRASIPPSTEMQFTKEIWKLNYEFFSSLDKPILIKDTDKHFQAFCAYLHFPKTMSMQAFCEWHIQHLLKYI